MFVKICQFLTILGKICIKSHSSFHRHKLSKLITVILQIYILTVKLSTSVVGTCFCYSGIEANCNPSPQLTKLWHVICHNLMSCHTCNYRNNIMQTYCTILHLHMFKIYHTYDQYLINDNDLNHSKHFNKLVKKCK